MDGWVMYREDGSHTMVLVTLRQQKTLLNVIDCDRRKTAREKSESIGISKSIVRLILTCDLKLSRVSARWVPRLLTEEEKQVWVSASRIFLLFVSLNETAHFYPTSSPLMYALQQFNRSLESAWFVDMFQTWVKRHHKCIAHNEKYFEKE